MRRCRHGLMWCWRSGSLQQAQAAQLAPQIFRHVAGTRRGAVKIARRIIRGEVAPALECTVGARLDRHRLTIKHDVAAADAVIVEEWADVEDPLAAHDLAANHPIK